MKYVISFQQHEDLDPAKPLRPRVMAYLVDSDIKLAAVVLKPPGWFHLVSIHELGRQLTPSDAADIVLAIKQLFDTAQAELRDSTQSPSDHIPPPFTP